MSSSAAQVSLSGQLICKDADEAAIVSRHLPDHLRLTCAEPGCLSFAVTRTHDELVWQVEELFADADAFRAHQTRVAASAWGRATRDVERRYEIVGLETALG